MVRIPRRAHFVFGLKRSRSPFHFLHYVAIESCRQVLRPNEIFFHYHHLPFGEFWDLVRPHLHLHRVPLVDEVLETNYDERLVPPEYRYAHHADFVRLDALIEHGGVYADIDTVFVNPFPESLFEGSFVIGRERPVPDERTGELKPSLCNALLMAEPGSKFAIEWRRRMAGALNGTWNNHACFLPERLSREMPGELDVEPEESFFPVPCTQEGLERLLEGGWIELDHSYSVHLWSHVWWDAERLDFSPRHSGDFTYQAVREGGGGSALERLAHAYLPDLEVDDLGPSVR